MAQKTPYQSRSNRPAYEGRTKIHSGPETVTEWNVKRLAMAGILLLSLIMLGYWGFSGKDQPTQPAPLSRRTETPKPLTSTVPKILAPQAPDAVLSPGTKPTDTTLQLKLSDAKKVMSSREITELKKTIRNENNHVETNEIPEKQTEGIQTLTAKPKTTEKPSKQVIYRSVLARRIVNKEPVQAFNDSIRISKGQSVTINYFTEIKGMKGKSVYHEWSKNNRTVFRRRIHITGDRWRASSRKVFNQTSAGQWQTRTVDDRKQILDRKNFTIGITK